MRRRRPDQSGDTVSLFPFLAVLICTMGALIMLLVLAVKAAEENAQQSESQTSEELRDHLSQINDQIEALQLQTQSLVTQREQFVAELGSARKKRGHVEEQQRMLARQIQQAKSRLVEITSPQPQNVDLVESSKEIERLEALLKIAESDLAEATKASAFKKPGFKINVGPSRFGTNRLPIFIECEADRIVFQPNEIELFPQDFNLPLMPGNPIDAALLAVREYWTRTGISKEAEPYPLIVVRPGGESSYALVRQAMANWDDEFGYELIEAERDIHFGMKDDGTAKVIRSAISYAKDRQKIRQAGGIGSGNGGITQLAEVHHSHASAHHSSEAFQHSTNAFSQNTNFSPTPGDFQPAKSHSGGQRKNDHRRHLPDDLVDRSNSAAPDRSNSGQSVPNEQLRNDSIAQRVPSQASGQRGSSYDVYLREARQWYGNSNSRKSNQRSQQLSGNSNQSKSAGQGNSRLGQCDCLAKKRGQNWALPSVQSNGIAYRRPVYLKIHRSGYAILGDDQKFIPVKGASVRSNEEAVDLLVKHIWKVIDSWGYAGERAYWKPELQVRVEGGGENNFALFSQLLDQSGLDVKAVSD